MKLNNEEINKRLTDAQKTDLYIYLIKKAIEHPEYLEDKNSILYTILTENNLLLSEGEDSW